MNLLTEFDPVGTHKLKANGWLRPVTVTRVSAKTLQLEFAYNKTLLTEVKNMSRPRWQAKKKVWHVADTIRTRWALAYLSGHKVFETFDRDADGTFDEIASDRTLYAHQRVMLDHMLSRRRSIIAGEMGTGKTLAAIELMEHADQIHGVSDWWYIAPKSALASVEIELMRWQSEVGPDMMTYERMKNVLAASDEIPQGVIFDESSRLKNGNAQRTKAAMALVDEMERRHGDKAFVCLMTGTPAPHDPLDWWSQAEIARPGFLAEGHPSKLRDRLAVVEIREGEYGNYPAIVSWKEDEIEKLGRRLNGLVLTIYKRDCLDLPDKRYDERPLQPTEKILRAAKLVAETGGAVVQVLAKHRQLSDGFLYPDEEDAEIIRGHTPKDDELRQILADHDETGRLVVYAGFHESIDRCCQTCSKEGWDVIKYDGRGLQLQISHKATGKELLAHPWKDGKATTLAQAVTMFQTPTEYPRKIAFIGHPSSGGMGLTLTASPTIVYFSNDFNAESRMQSEDRIHRPGADHNRGVTIIDLMCLPTDTLVLNNLKAKRDLQTLSMEEILRVMGAAE